MSISQHLLEKFKAAPLVSSANALLAQGLEMNIKNVAGAVKSLLLVNFATTFNVPVAYVGVDLDDVEAIKEEVEAIASDLELAFFPAPTTRRNGFGPPSSFVHSERLSSLERLAEARADVVLLNAEALLYKLPNPSNYLTEKVELTAGQEFEFEQLVTRLVDYGFSRELRAERSGEMSVRGGIIDVFPFSTEMPYRIEFWDDRIESIRHFDPLTQRSDKEVKRLNLYPHDFIYSDKANNGQAAESGGSFLLDYLSSEAVVVFDEPRLIRKTIEDEICRAHRQAPEMDDQELNAHWSRLIQKANDFRRVNFVSIGTRHSNLVDLGARNQESCQGSFDLLKKNLAEFIPQKAKQATAAPEIFFLCEDEHRSEQLFEICREEDISYPQFNVASLRIHNGFIFMDAGLVVYSENQFYGRARRLRLPKKSRGGLSPQQLKYLSVGDYVVHVDFGVGVFRGLTKINIRDNESECLHLEYQDGDNLYVKLERMDRVHKYASKDGIQPKLSKLGSADWQRLKSRTKKKIKDIANELIAIYAKRKAQDGVSFSGDTLWQKELEASFPYEDTPDQQRATVEVKEDMQSPKPMDRLICGDVGFGKTEIAVRAAFKAVLSGKQVAMLVPTTILAYQHYNTFTERLRPFPVKVEMLSRFKKKPQQKQIVEEMKRGQVDIVIGTHRLLSKDVDFKDLGLLIVDEEQRFGVRHKERLKKLRATVDVLTLTATPIPRTLYLSLMGARDITNINTAPRNRLPITTEILTLNKGYIREAILRELDRGGQVFFVHNRVKTIDGIATMLSGLIPEAKIVVGHGQMDEKELEKVMVDFMNREYDILVSTMIIENGLDMPNVNTIIVNRADKLGLAQLYQLRGRVGRSNQRAFAYLLIPPVETLTEEALKRLRAIEEFSEVGSGNQLAMRDLEIRGAGNLLGAEQSGYIDALGFDLYNKIVDEAVRELRAEQELGLAPSDPIETHVVLNAGAYLPENYVPSGSERVDIYRRLNEASELQQVSVVQEELRDRFGRLPRSVENLLAFFSLRILGRKLCLKRIEVNGQEAVAEFDPQFIETNGEPFKSWLGSIVANAVAPFEFVQNHTLGIRLAMDDRLEDRFGFLQSFLQSISPKESADRQSGVT